MIILSYSIKSTDFILTQASEVNIRHQYCIRSITKIEATATSSSESSENGLFCFAGAGGGLYGAGTFRGCGFGRGLFGVGDAADNVFGVDELPSKQQTQHPVIKTISCITKDIPIKTGPTVNKNGNKRNYIQSCRNNHYT